MFIHFKLSVTETWPVPAVQFNLQSLSVKVKGQGQMLPKFTPSEVHHDTVIFLPSYTNFWSVVVQFLSCADRQRELLTHRLTDTRTDTTKTIAYLVHHHGWRAKRMTHDQNVIDYKRCMSAVCLPRNGTIFTARRVDASCNAEQCDSRSKSLCCVMFKY